MLWFEQSWLLLLIDVSIKSLALALVAWAALSLCRVKNANVRHRVWSAVLLGMLSLPLLVPLTPTVPLPRCLVPEISVADSRERTVPVEELRSDEALGQQDGVISATIAPRGDAQAVWTIQAATQPIVELPAVPHEMEKGTVVPPSGVEAPATRRSGIQASPNWSTASLALYSSISFAFLLRIIAGIWGTHRIIARSRPCSPAGVGATSHPILKGARVYESNDLRVPLTVGFLRPKILLPTAWRRWSESKLESVLAHEMAHIRRCDYLVALLAECNRAIHWFHPLAWLLRGWLSDLAEQNCDDAVIASTGKRAQYARHLLEVAGLLNEQDVGVAWGGIAMARKARVETRIDAILDAKRPLATRLSIVGALVLVSISVPAVLLAAALRPADASADTEASLTATVGERKEGTDLGNNETAGKAESSAGVPATESEGKGADAWRRIDSAAAVTDRLRHEANQNSHSLIRIVGQVVDHQGKGTKATVYVNSSYHSGELIRPAREQVLASFQTDANGKFDVRRKLPPRDNNIDSGFGRVEQLVAVATGHAVAISDMIGVRNGEAVTLKLGNDDISIEGRILDLEGQPIEGATLRIAKLSQPKGIEKLLDNLRVRAGEKPREPQMSFIMSKAFDASQSQYSNERRHGNQLDYSQLAPKAEKTDRDGRFRMDGVGRDRMLALEIHGPGIVTSWISVIARDMKPIGKTWYIANRTDRTYGAKFTFSAEPHQMIEGTVTDADTGKPIPGLTIESDGYQDGGNGQLRMFQPSNATAVTDVLGKYQLKGLPKSIEHALRLVVPDHLPYLSRTRVSVTEFAESLAPTKLDFKLKRTGWITGTVRNRLTGEPVSAQVLFSPHKDNEQAKDYSLRMGEYLDPLRMKHVAFETKSDGKFRVKAVPGGGLLAAICKDRIYCPGYGADELGAKWFTTGDGGEVTRTYHHFAREWMHAYRAVTAQQGTIEAGLEVDPGNLISVSLVDASGEPVEDVFVRSRAPVLRHTETPLRGPAVDIVAVQPNRPRGVLFYHRDRNLAAFLWANHSKPFTRETVKLEVCGVVKGRLLDQDRNPITGVGIGLKPTSLRSKGRRGIVPYTQTDKFGNFTVERFTPSAKFAVVAMDAPEPEVIAAAVELKPGEIRDLGEVTLTETRSRQLPRGLIDATPVEEADAKKKAEASKAVPGPASAALSVFNPTNDDRHKQAANLVYEGQVVLPNGSPAVGADVYFNYWRNTAHREILAKPVAKTDRDGRFRYTRPFRTMDIESKAGFLVAKMKGYGLAMASSQALETTGQLTKSLPDHPRAKAFVRKLERDKGPMRLLQDDAVIRGKIVDLEGHGVAKARITVTEIWSSWDSNDMTAWNEAIKNPKMDYVTIQNVMERQLRGPELPALLGAVWTDADGSFEIRGLGKHRVAKLAITGVNIVATSCYVRTDPAKTITMPFYRNGGFQPNQRDVRFYGNTFTQVVTQSRAIVGRVTDEETGDPIPGVVINSSKIWTTDIDDGGKPKVTLSGSDVAWTVSGDNGEYRLDGLPRVPRAFLRAVGGDLYLPKSLHADTSGKGLQPANLDIKLARGMVLEGRVVDAETGEGIEGRVEFFADSAPGGFAPMMGGPGIQTSTSDGRFRIVAPRKNGQLCFTAFNKAKYELTSLQPEKAGGKEPSTPRASPAMVAFRARPRFHAKVKVSVEEVSPFELKVKPAAVVLGHAVAPDGRRLRGLKYVGKTQEHHGWEETDSGSLKVYDLKKPRLIAVMCVEEKLAGLLILKEPKGDFGVQLQPWATLKGRLVNADREPLAGARLEGSSLFGHSWYYYSEQSKRDGSLPFRVLPLPPNPNDPIVRRPYPTDEDGNFEIPGIVGGGRYDLSAHYHPSEFEYYRNNVIKNLVLKPGETRDLGDVVLKNEQEVSERPRSSPKPVVVEVE